MSPEEIKESLRITASKVGNLGEVEMYDVMFVSKEPLRPGKLPFAKAMRLRIHRQPDDRYSIVSHYRSGLPHDPDDLKETAVEAIKQLRNTVDSFDHRGLIVHLVEDDSFKKAMGGNGNINYRVYVNGQCVSEDHAFGGGSLEIVKQAVMDWIDTLEEES